MKFKPEEFKAKTAELLQSLGDQAKVSAILTELVEHNDDATAELTTATATSTKLTADNEGLRKVNMDLFLKVGSSTPKPEDKPTPDNTPKYEDLFDKNGNLVK